MDGEEVKLLMGKNNGSTRDEEIDWVCTGFGFFSLLLFHRADMHLCFGRPCLEYWVCSA